MGAGRVVRGQFSFLISPAESGCCCLFSNGLMQLQLLQQTASTRSKSQSSISPKFGLQIGCYHPCSSSQQEEFNPEEFYLSFVDGKHFLKRSTADADEEKDNDDDDSLRPCVSRSWRFKQG